MTTRTERILTKLAQQHAPGLLNGNLPPNASVRYLADGLVKEGVLVITCEASRQLNPRTVNAWAMAYHEMYSLLTEALFPSYTRFSAVDADNQSPPLMVLRGEVSAVMRVLGAFVVPFIASRQANGEVYKTELSGIMMTILRDLEGTDLPKPAQDKIMTDGEAILRRLLEMPVRQQSLTTAHASVMQRLKKPPPDPPSFLPEEPPMPETPTEELFTKDIPLFFKKRKRDDDDDQPWRSNGKRGNDDRR